MTGKKRFAKAPRFEEPDRPPHFESMFELELCQHNAERYEKIHAWAEARCRQALDLIDRLTGAGAEESR